MASIFVSYKSIDRDFVIRLANDLQNHDHEIWLDIWKITGTQPYWDEIKQGIDKCSHFIFVISPESIDPISGSKLELEHAAGQPQLRKTVIPIMLRPVAYESLPILISPGRLQIHDFTKLSYDQLLKNVLTALGETVNPLAHPKTEKQVQQTISPQTLEAVREDDRADNGSEVLLSEDELGELLLEHNIRCRYIDDKNTAWEGGCAYYTVGLDMGWVDEFYNSPTSLVEKIENVISKKLSCEVSAKIDEFADTSLLMIDIELC